MKFPSKATIEQYRREYPVGCRDELISMDDPQAPPIGTRGTVRGVDDAGNLLVRWDNGSGLNAVLGVDVNCHCMDLHFLSVLHILLDYKDKSTGY